MKVLVENKKALFDYDVVDRYEAGVKLLGHEVKAVREGKTNMRSCFVSVRNGNAILKNFQINKYSKTTQATEPGRDKVLLLHKNEIEKINSWTAQGGQTVVPIKLYDKEGLIKLEIGLVKGRKKYEKKQKIKEREVNKRLKQKFGSI